MTVEHNLRTIKGLEPASVWRFFAEIAAVPRPSKKETKIREHMRNLAAALGLTLREDRIGNQVIDVPATPGYESAPITVLQGHLDMVCEKNAGTEHDFDRDPIRFVIEAETETGRRILRADGTTLGADNGIGVAMGLAAATAPDVIHGPLELLLTVDEEMGMTGADVLTPDFFHGRRMLNLDSEEDDSLYIGCAGGCDTTLTWSFNAVAPASGDQVARVLVNGLRGGHSGGDIHEGRGNAIKILTQTLTDAGCDSLKIARITGGSKRNAIPREAEAVVVGEGSAIAALNKAAKTVREEAARACGEANLAITVSAAALEDGSRVIAPDDTRRLLTAIADLPHGVLGMHPSVEDLVETSNNVATIDIETVDKGKTLRVAVGNLSRSSSAQRIQEALDTLAATGANAGASVETANAYPGWAPNLESPILATCRRVYSKLFHEEPKVLAIHAGLECGIIGERVGGSMDMVSLGPTLTGAHSPDERLYIDSVPKTWGFLKAILAELARG